MAIEVIMPQGGQDIEVGTVMRWLKAEGDRVAEGEVICEVETEKAVFEVEAPGSGILRQIIIGEAQETAIFSVIAYIGEPEEPIPSPQDISVAQKGTPISSSSSSLSTTDRTASTPDRITASPRARRLADQKGIPLEQLSGTGAKGRITEKDVLAFIEATKGEPLPGIEEQIDGGRVVTISKIRKVTARKMQQSKQTVPHFYATLSADMTQALEIRAKFNNALSNPEEESLSITDLIIRACALAFSETPELNSSILDEDRIVLWEDLNFGIAVAVDSELVVPVMENVDELPISDIAKERRRLVEKASQGKQYSLAPARFTISNLGMYQIEQFIAIINPPETAILAVSSLEKRPVAIDGQMGLRDMLTLTLSVDHRVVDGVVACRFINMVKTLLEEPDRLL
jgi:pyruvate dehydrogenase E2 component (dihydrolipoamide acetyltransferase)